MQSSVRCFSTIHHSHPASGDSSRTVQHPEGGDDGGACPTKSLVNMH